MDNSFIIDNLLQQQESVRLEFKAKPEKAAIAKVITSFINTQGGDLIIGIDDDKTVVGVGNAEKVQQSIKKILIESITPNAPISIQLIRYKRKDVILISVWEGAKKPYQFRGKIFTRENDATKVSNREILNYLIKERKEADFHWERRTVLGADIKDLDIEEINKTINEYKSYKKDSSFEDAEDFLIQMGLIKNGNLTNACIVLFAKKPSLYIPQSRIRLTVHPSNKTEDKFINDRIFEGNLFKNITAILNFIDITFGKSIVVEGVLRKEKYNYPLLALREGLLNAMVHRDYNSVNGFLQVSIFNNRTEISNYGGLPEGITIRDLKKEHNSILRNTDIAQMCFIRKYIEMLGSGTLRMIDDCKRNGFKSPSWTDKDDITTVTFPELAISSKKDISEGVNEGVNEGVKSIVVEGESEGVNEELNILFQAVVNNPGLKAPAIAKIIDKSLSSTERYIRKLKGVGLIEYKGTSKKGGYFKTDIN